MCAKLTIPRRAAQEVFGHRLRIDPIPFSHRLTEKFLADGYEDGSLARLHDYNKMAEYVRGMPTAAERIKFVNPFERDWTAGERKWHRVQHRPLHAPRRAWSIPPTPHYFDCLDFYKYVTRMSEVEGRGVPFNFPVSRLEKRLTESLVCSLNGDTQWTKTTADEFLRRALDDAFSSLAHTNDLLDLRISHAPHCESFWICAGFEHLYRKFDFMSSEPADYVFQHIRSQKRLIGDHRQKLGELVFTMRDELVAQVRQRTPIEFPKKWTRIEGPELSLTEVKEKQEALKQRLEGAQKFPEMEESQLTDAERKDIFNVFESFDVNRDEFVFTPTVYNLSPDPEPLWQCPGYESENGVETHPFGRLAIKNVYAINEYLDLWGMEDPEETTQTIESFLRSTAVTTLFNWLNAQVHAAGYTQYGFVDNGEPTDFDQPFCSRLILSDGRMFFFATADLQTIAFNISVKGFKNKRMNGIVFDGPFNLYDEYDPTTATFKHRPDPQMHANELVDGLNPNVMNRLLGTLLSK